MLKNLRNVIIILLEFKETNSILKQPTRATPRPEVNNHKKYGK